MSVIETCALTSQQEDAWSKTRVALLWHCPAFAHIFYSLLNKRGSKHVAVFTKDASVCPIAATDGNNILINPDTFFQFNLDQRIFIVAHEILHCVWNHLVLMHQFKNRGKIAYPDGKTLPYEHQLMNVATDLVINDLLISSGIGAMPEKGGQKVGLHDPAIATGNDSAIDAYRKVYKDNPKGGYPGGKGFDSHLAPGQADGQDPTQAAQDRNPTEWKTQVAAAMNAAKVQGKLPAALERAFAEILDPQVDWREKIRGFFARKVGTGGYDWRRPDRRLISRKEDPIISPGRSGFGAGTVVVGADTSGSIGDKELNMFFAEVAGILEDVRPKRLVIVWCDAKVQRVDDVEEPSDLNVLRHKGAPGGGGTSFIPVFDYIRENDLEPDALVYLTDGLGSFPGAPPSFPVIWGNIYPNAQYPFGEVVDIPKVA